MRPEPTYYDLLGVRADASPDEVKSAFRAYAKRNHPDQGGNQVLFEMLQSAYRTLVDPQRREAYDVWLTSTGEDTPPGGVSMRFDAEDVPADWAHAATSTHFLNRDPDDLPSCDDARNDWTSGSSVDAHRWASTQPDDAVSPEFKRTAPKDRRTVSIVLVGALGCWLILSLLSGSLLVPGFSIAEAVALCFLLLLFWGIGSFALRLGGWALTVIALVDAHWNDAPELLTAQRLVAAFALWLLGQWFYTFKYNRWHSTVAHNMLVKLPGCLRPDWRFNRE